MAEQSTHTGQRPSTLDAHGLLGWARRCVEQLAAHREEINALNVFPVADSDTGTNLLHTMRAAVDRAEGEEAWTAEGGGTAGAREIAVSLGHGAVHGARGNSGVILSQVLRAVGEAATFTVVDAATYRRALRTAVTLVDHALSDPVEGTIVTVLREAATATGRSSATSLVEVARVAADAAADALDRTPTQLPALTRAGVVDAGGRGLLVLLDTMVEVLTGQAPRRSGYTRPAAPPGGERTAGAPAAGDGAAGSWTDDDEPGTRYEVMYSLTHSDDHRADELRTTLRALGDSVVVVGDGGAGDLARWAVHVHTDEIGPAIEVGLPMGRVTEIRVTDMLDEAGACPPQTDAAESTPRSATTRATPAPDPDPDAHPDPAPSDTPRAVVAVVPAGPLAELFRASGALVVAPGPGGDEAVEEILTIPAAELVVLPNGELPRDRVVSLDAALRDVGRHALILPTVSLVQGLSALAVHDPATTLSIDGFGMADAAGATRHAHLVRAEQDALTMVGRCEAGDVLGVIGHDVALIASDAADGVCTLVDRMLAVSGELVTLLLGDEFGADSREAVVESIRAAHPTVEVEGYEAGPGPTLARIGVE